MNLRTWALFSVASFTLIGCLCAPPTKLEDDAGSLPDAGDFDAGAFLDGGFVGGEFDAGEPDAGEPDAGEPDAGEPDAGEPDAGEPDGGDLDAGTSDSGCGFGTAASLAAPGSLDLFGAIAYFNDGGTLPSGHYKVQYVDGCMKYSAGQGWTIHAYANGSSGWWMVGATSADKVLMPPGTVGWSPAAGAFTNFADCVAANLLLNPTEFDFDGGVLGVWLQDTPYTDNLAGEGGRNPVWSLQKLGGDCVQ